jgi:hypothetical protein
MVDGDHHDGPCGAVAQSVSYGGIATGYLPQGPQTYRGADPYQVLSVVIHLRDEPVATIGVGAGLDAHTLDRLEDLAC